MKRLSMFTVTLFSYVESEGGYDIASVDIFAITKTYRRALTLTKNSIGEAFETAVAKAPPGTRKFEFKMGGQEYGVEIEQHYVG